MRLIRLAPTAALLLLAGALACSDGSSVGLAFSTRSMSAAAATQASDSTVVVRGDDTLVIKSVQLVLREIELKRIEELAANCPDSANDDDDACEEFSTGLQLVDLPLGNATDRVVTVEIPAGTYDKLEFEIHKPDQIRDAAFIAANPAFARASIRVTGTFSHAGSRSDFVYTTDLNAEQEIELVPALVVETTGQVNLTIRLDIASWFLSGAGTALIAPATANDGGANENVVRDAIERSIDAFHDNDGDGLDDDHEDDDHGSSHDGPGA